MLVLTLLSKIQKLECDWMWCDSKLEIMCYKEFNVDIMEQQLELLKKDMEHTLELLHGKLKGWSNEIWSILCFFLLEFTCTIDCVT